MTEREPNSRRYWRMNTMMALRETSESEADARDPEHLAHIRANRAELAQLEARETAVRARSRAAFFSLLPTPPVDP